MKKSVTFLLTALAATFPLAAQSPQARPEAVVRSGNARFTVLTPQMLRIEYSDQGLFEERATFVVQHRDLGPVPPFSTREDADFLYITTDSLRLRYRKGAPLSLSSPSSADDLTIALTHVSGESTPWYPGKPDPLNLKGTCRTLDRCEGDSKRSELEDGLISRSGWAVIDDSWSNVRPDGSRSFALAPDSVMGFDWWQPRADSTALDLYFLGYGKHYKQALADFTRLAGKIPLPPAYVFGYWYSRYAAYTSADVRQIIAELGANDIPADVMIIDMDWHWNGRADCGSEGIGSWTGWSWNTKLIPDAPQLLADIHADSLRVALNLHPAQGVNSTESPRQFAAMQADLAGKYLNDNNIAWSLDYPDFAQSFFKHVIREREGEGVDFWWLDWQQYLTSPTTPGLGETFWCNHVFFNEMSRSRADRRPVIFHRWGGLGCHRYQIGFSGDAAISFPTLAFEPYFTATASNVGYTYWGHDIGGHNLVDRATVNDPEMVLRWMQFGVFTPILRTHAAKNKAIERRIWKFDNFPLLRDAVKLRYALFPYIYTMARQTYDSGIGLCRPLYYDYPDREEAYSFEDEYFFGDNILVAPITAPADADGLSRRSVWLPEGKWWCVDTHELIEGPCVRSLAFSAEQIPYFYRAGAPIPLNPAGVSRVMEQPDRLVLHVVAGSAGSSQLYEDEGDNPDYASRCAFTSLSHEVDGLTESYRIAPRRGEQAGLPAERGWMLTVFNADAPRSVCLDGRKLADSDWSYDAKARCLTVDVPKGDCGKGADVVVTYKR